MSRPMSLARSRHHQCTSSAVVTPGVIAARLSPSSSHATVHPTSRRYRSVSSASRVARKSRASNSADTSRAASSGPIAESRYRFSSTLSPSAIGSVADIFTPIRRGSRSATTRARCGRSPSGRYP